MKQPNKIGVNQKTIPKELKKFPHWVLWAYEKDSKGNLTKIPKVADAPHNNADSTDPKTWRTFQQAVNSYQNHKTSDIAGIGFVLSKDSPFCGIDIDNCIDPATGEISPEAEECIKEVDSYAETSPSLTGVKIFAKGKLPGPNRNFKRFGVEMYSCDRFFTVTGLRQSIASANVEDRQVVITKIYNRKSAEYDGPQKNNDQPKNNQNWDGELFSLKVSHAVKRLIEKGDDDGHRSEAIASVLTALTRSGYPERVIFDIFNQYPIGEKYKEKGRGKDKWLRDEIKRIRTKFANVNTEDNNFNKPEDFPFPPLKPENTILRGVVTERPPEHEYILEFKGTGLFTKRVVGSLSAAGGTGKTRLFGNISVMAARGNEWGYFSAPNPLKTLFLCAEETQDDLDRILWDAADGDFPDGLFAVSIKGKIGPLMELKDNNPIKSIWWYWLDQTITNHPNLDLLLLDPKSRLYGLSENDNDHNTAWISCLEALTEKYGMSVWFAHHVPKNTKEINQWMGRGGSALIDACRTNMGMIQMTKEEGKKFGIEDWTNYIKIAKNKINIGPKDIGDAYLKFEEQGRLLPANPYAEKIEGMATHLLFVLNKDDQAYSRRELIKEDTGRHIYEQMKAKFPKFTRSMDMDAAIDKLLFEGMLIEEETFKTKRPKTLLKVNGKKYPDE